MTRGGLGGRLSRAFLILWAVAVVVLMALMFLARGGDQPIPSQATFVRAAEAAPRA